MEIRHRNEEGTGCESLNYDKITIRSTTQLELPEKSKENSPLGYRNQLKNYPL